MRVYLQLMPRITLDTSILEAALVGLRHRRDEIEARIRSIRQTLGESKPGPRASTTTTAPRRVFSASARRRIAEAQRKRWAAQKSAEQSPPKRARMSAAARQRIARAAKKRWAAFRAAQAATRGKEGHNEEKAPQKGRLVKWRLAG
jgi:septal ring factor EnvC (AmiA/AmiB activator)